MMTNNSLLHSCAALALLAFAAPAAAQSTVPPPDIADTPAEPSTETAVRASPPAEQTTQADIVVTGSRIRRDPLSQDSPIVFVDQEDIAKTGLSSVNDVLQRLPSSGGGLNSKFNNSGNLGNPPDGGGVGAGSAEIDLRYLGSRRVLVLVDGVRYVNGASASGVPGSTDLNSIPESAIERIEVLQDGASAIYGSDAIAGVVNIITKRRQEGFQFSAQAGGYAKEGDGLTQNYQLSWGNGRSGPFQVVVGANYVDQNPVRSGDRALSAFPEPYSTTCLDGGCSSFTPLGRFSVFGRDLTLRSPVIGRTPIFNPANPTDPNSDFKAFTTADRFNFGPFNFLQIPVERLGGFANARYEVSPAINVSAKLIANRRKSMNQAAPLPFGIGPASGLTPVLSSIQIDATNPFNPFGVTLNSSNTSFILRRFVEGGPRRFNQTVDTVYGIGTVDGRFNLGANEWFWDVNAAYGQNKARQRMLGNINADRLRRALGPVANCVAPCVPFNIFGGAGSITQAMLDYVTFIQNDSSEQKTWDLTGNVSGSLFQLPGGPLGAALGVQYRKLDGRFDPDDVVAAGFSSDIPARPTKGEYSVREAYLELNAPVLSDIPAVQLLELNGAVRLSDYSTSGSTKTFKGQVNYKPVDFLRLRGSYAEGFRAPSIGELFGTQSRFDQPLSDPCSAGSTAPRNFANDATVRANCIAAGVPASGTYQQANPQISVLVGGNQDLTPETSKSWIFGGVFSSSRLPGISLEANHYNIKLRGAIQSVNASITLTRCVVQNDPAACALVTRAPRGELLQVAGLLQNIAGIDTKGWDVNFGYRLPPTDLGNFRITWNNTFLKNYDVSVPTSTGTQVISREGTEQGSPSQGFPRWKTVAILDWDLSQFGATLTGRNVSQLREPNARGNIMTNRLYTDLQGRWMPDFLGQRFGLAVGANNLFNIKTPGCVSCDINNIDPTVHDIPGRFVYARLSARM